MALRTTTRTIRSGRPRRRRIRRSHRHWSRQRLPIVATSVGLLGLLGLLVLAYFMTGKDKEDGCIELVGVDKSASQNTQRVVDRWAAEVDTIVDRAASCKGVLIAETVFDQPGKGEVFRIPLTVHAINSLDEQRKRRELSSKAKAAIEKVLNRPAGGRTNIIGWFEAIEAHLQDMSGKYVVNVTIFTDGINTVIPLDMPKADLTPKGVAALIDRIRPDLPDCSGWHVRMLGVNTTNVGGVDPQLAQGAERFWRAFLEACGGDLVRYDTAVQAP